MYLTSHIPYLKSARNNFLVALSVAAITVFIIIFLRPFGAGDTDFEYKNIYFMGYGLVVIGSYYLILGISKWYYNKSQIWYGMEEISFGLLFISITISLAFLYTEYVINGIPSRVNFPFFFEWFRIMFFGFGLLLLVTTLLLRSYFNKVPQPKLVATENSTLPLPPKEVTIQSSLKKESIIILFEKLVYIESEDNYIHVCYVEENQVHQKMLRNTLKDVQKQIPELVRIHRSYLVNPNFMESLKGNSQNAKLHLRESEVRLPASKTYYNLVKSLIH